MFLSNADGDVGNFLSCLKGVKEPFVAQEVRWDFSREAAGEKGLSSPGGENLLVFLELRWDSSRVTMGTSGTRSWGHREVRSPRESERPLGIPLQSMRGLRSSSGFEAGASGFISRADLNLGVPLGSPEGSETSSRVLACKSALISSRKSVSGFVSGFMSG